MAVTYGITHQIDRVEIGFPPSLFLSFISIHASVALICEKGKSENERKRESSGLRYFMIMTVIW